MAKNKHFTEYPEDLKELGFEKEAKELAVKLKKEAEELGVKISNSTYQFLDHFFLWSFVEGNLVSVKLGLYREGNHIVRVIFTDKDGNDVKMDMSMTPEEYMEPWEVTFSSSVAKIDEEKDVNVNERILYDYHTGNDLALKMYLMPIDKHHSNLMMTGKFPMYSLSERACECLTDYLSDFYRQVYHCQRWIEDERKFSNYRVKIESYGGSKVKTIKALHDFTGMGLKEAKELIDQVPNAVVNLACEDDAFALAKIVSEWGALVMPA